MPVRVLLGSYLQNVLELEWTVSLPRFMESIGAVASPRGSAGGRSRSWLSPSRESSGLPVEAKGQVRAQLMVALRAPGQGGWALSWETFPFPGVFTTS